MENTHTNNHHPAAFTAIITHPGVFHADEVCAVAYICLLGFKGPVHRRNPTEEELADPSVCVIDVGSKYEPELSNFDHHQRGYTNARWDSEVPYASFGQVVDRFPHSDPVVHDWFDRMFVQPIDATDSGWGTVEGTRPQLSLSKCIRMLNPSGAVERQDRDEAFNAATALATSFIFAAMRTAETVAEAKKVVMAADATTQSKTLILEQFATWQEHIFDRADIDELAYVAYPSERGGWCLQNIPKEPGSFEGKQPLPAKWYGLRGEAFASTTGLQAWGDATFCHPNGFVAGAETKEDVLYLARAACHAAHEATREFVSS